MENKINGSGNKNYQVYISNVTINIGGPEKIIYSQLSRRISFLVRQRVKRSHVVRLKKWVVCN